MTRQTAGHSCSHPLASDSSLVPEWMTRQTVHDKLSHRGRQGPAGVGLGLTLMRLKVHKG